jgi:hypothetical protein
MVAFANLPAEQRFPAETEREAGLYANILAYHYQLQAQKLLAESLKSQLRRYLSASYDAADGHVQAALRQLVNLLPDTEQLLS